MELEVFACWALLTIGVGVGILAGAVGFWIIIETYLDYKREKRRRGG